MATKKFADRVKETTTTTGTGTYDLAGPVTGFLPFQGTLASGSEVYYTVENGTDFEVGIGVSTAGTPDTLSRATILRSSNANAAVNWGAGTKNVFLTVPADIVEPLAEMNSDNNVFSISLESGTAGAGTDGKSLTVSAGDGEAATNGSGGDITITAGNGVGTGDGGNVTISAGDGDPIGNLSLAGKEVDITAITALKINSVAGTTGQVLTSQGASSPAVWADAAGGGSVYYKDAVRLATTANGVIGSAFVNGASVDGVTLATGDRILLKNQTNATENGIYVVNASGAPTRAADCNSSSNILTGISTYVLSGTINSQSRWVLSTAADPVVVGTTSLRWGGDQNIVYSTGNYRNVVTAAGSLAISGSGTGANSLAISIGSLASGSYSVAIGNQTTASGSRSVALGGNDSADSNKTQATATGTVAIGSNARAVQTNNVSIGYNCGDSGGSGGNSVAVGYAATIGGEFSVNVGALSSSGNYGVAIGKEAKAATTFANAIGAGVYADVRNETVLGTQRFSSTLGNVGDATVSIWLGRAVTTDATPTEIGNNATTLISTTINTYYLLRNDSSYIFDCDIVARNTATDDESAMYNLKFGLRRGAAAANTSLVGTPVVTVIGEDTGTTGWDVSVTADTTNGRANILVTGEASKTIRWVCTAIITKVAG